MKPEKNNTFCYYPFYQVALKTWDHRGFVNAAPCCNAIRPENTDPLNLNSKIENLTHEEVFNSPAMQELRESMLNGEKHSACATCWKMEDKGIVSYRTYSNIDYELTEDKLTDPELTCIDFNFGDNCNLRCRMCQPGLSNKLRLDYKFFRKNNLDTHGIQGYEPDVLLDYREQWKAENSEHEVLSWPDESTQWDNILNNIHKLTQIRAAGGETTITKPFVEFIDKAIEVDHAKNVTLNFHTNATKFTDEFLNKLFKFKCLDLNFSIDSYGKNYEYIRYPMPWKTVDKSIRKFFEKSKFSTTKITVQCTNVLSSINAFNIPEIYRYWNELKKEYPNVTFNFWVDFIWPESKFTNVKFLSREIKLELIDLYTKTFGETAYGISHIIDYLKNNLDFEVTDTHRADMLRELVVFDQARNQTYRDYIDARIINFLETKIND
jgi:hypothetical protein